MTSDTIKSSATEYILIRVYTLVGLLLIASGSARSYVILSFLGEILIPSAISVLLWTINWTLIVSGLIEIIAVIQVLRGKINSSRQIISLGLLMGFLVLVVSLVQQFLIPLQFYDFVVPDIMGWLGMGLGTLLRVNMSKSQN